jgi:cell division protein FtsI/penicillin-binding protein 2
MPFSLAGCHYNQAMLRGDLAVRRCVLALVCAAVPLNAAAQAVGSILQNALTRAMNHQSGAAVVVDVHSGRVLASSHLDVTARRVAAPGSSIKPFTLLALLEAGKVNPQTALVCKRSVFIGGHKLDCSHPETSEPLDPAAALAYSCNSYFTAVALRLSPGELRNSFVHDGFASVSGIEANEVAGSVALAQSPEQVQLQAIGEWGVVVTPLELLKGYRTLALLQSKHDVKLEPLFAGLEQSVTYGMGHAAQPIQPMKVAGKTGTAPAVEGAWTHAWFAGYAPAENPEIVLVVFLEKGNGGSEAATVARQVFSAFAEAQIHSAPAGGAQP